MEGFVLCAGMGSRLRPLTDHRPKALVEVRGVPLLQLAVERLCHFGIRHIVVNVHHLADQVEAFVRSRRWEADITLSDERACLMDTGGALAQAAPLFGGAESVLVHNVDVLSGIDLAALAECHRAEGNLVTLCASRRESARRLLFDADRRLAGREGEAPAEGCIPLAFSGVSVVSPDLFALLPTAGKPFPIIPQYIALSATHPIRCFEHPAEQWLDVGRPETLKQAQQWTPFSDK